MHNFDVLELREAFHGWLLLDADARERMGAEFRNLMESLFPADVAAAEMDPGLYADHDAALRKFDQFLNMPAIDREGPEGHELAAMLKAWLGMAPGEEVHHGASGDEIILESLDITVARHEVPSTKNMEYATEAQGVVIPVQDHLPAVGVHLRARGWPLQLPVVLSLVTIIILLTTVLTVVLRRYTKRLRLMHRAALHRERRREYMASLREKRADRSFYS